MKVGLEREEDGEIGVGNR